MTEDLITEQQLKNAEEFFSGDNQFGDSFVIRLIHLVRRLRGIVEKAEKENHDLRGCALGTHPGFIPNDAGGHECILCGGLA